MTEPTQTTISCSILKPSILLFLELIKAKVGLETWRGTTVTKGIMTCLLCTTKAFWGWPLISWKTKHESIQHAAVTFKWHKQIEAQKTTGSVCLSWTKASLRKRHELVHMVFHVTFLFALVFSGASVHGKRLWSRRYFTGATWLISEQFHWGNTSSSGFRCCRSEKAISRQWWTTSSCGGGSIMVSSLGAVQKSKIWRCLGSFLLLHGENQLKIAL